MTDLKELKEKLITLDYPEVKSIKTNEDVLRIISPENRKTFLKWIFEKMEPGVFSSLDEGTIYLRIHKLVEYHGFCPYEETTNFVNGDMDYEAQLNVLEKILNFLVICSSPNDKNVNLSSHFEDFDSLINYIDKTLPNVEFNLDETTDNLKKEKESLMKVLEKNDLIDLDLKEIKELNMEELKNNLNNFQIKYEFKKSNKNEPNHENKAVKIPHGLKDELNKFVKKQENIDVVGNFKENLSSIHFEDKPINEKVQELVCLTKEIHGKN